MSSRVGRLDLRRFLERRRGFVITLQAVVRVAEIFVRVGANLSSFLKADRIRLTSFTKQLDRLLARLDSLLKLIVMVISKTQIVVDLGTARITFYRFLVDVDCFGITIEPRE